jgi:hypothetical protein
VREEEADETLSQLLTDSQYQAGEMPAALRRQAWDSVVSEAIFGADHPPR